MAAVTRQPFAPLDGTRLQSLTSARNQQASLSSPGKRKAADFLNVDDFENVDPALLFSKRSKADGPSKDFFKPNIITKSSFSSASFSSKDGISAPAFNSSVKGALPRPRSILNPKSPAKKLSSLSRGTAASPMSAPAGRSPTRGNKRIGILNRRRTRTFTRIDPPTFSLSSTPFSLAAAIKGTVPSYAGKTKAGSATSSLSLSSSDDFYGSNVKSSWEFDIHEDTPEQEMTNLLQHSTCRLDISSDEECQRKASRDKAEGRGKENIPPADDVSQTSVRRATTMSEGGMEYEKPRTALGDLNVEDFYAEGCDPTSVFIVPEDEDDGTVVDGEQQPEKPQAEGEGAASGAASLEETKATVAEIAEPEESEEPVKLATLQPVEGTGESFDLWESSSAKEEGDGAPSPVPASPAPSTGEDFGDDEG